MGLWRVEEAAEYLGIRPKTLYEWVRLDRVPYRKIGFNVRFDPAELERWTAEQARGATTGGRKGASRPGKGRPEAGDIADAETRERTSVQPADHLLAELAADASAMLRDLERDVGTSLTFPQRRKIIDLADRLDLAAAAVRRV